MKTTQRKTVKASKTSAPLEVKIGAAPKTLGAPTSEVIAKRAYELYLARGRQGGHEIEDWMQAETELRAR
jgi:hypothetical protein